MVQLTFSSLVLPLTFLGTVVHAQSYPQDRFSLQIIPRVSATSAPTFYNTSNPIYLSRNGGVTNSSTAYVCSLWSSDPYQGELHCMFENGNLENNALGISSNVASQPLLACVPQHASDRPVGCFTRGFKYDKVTQLMQWPDYGSRFWLVETRDGAGELVGERTLWASIGKEEASGPVAGAVPVSLKVYSIYKMPTGPHRARRY